MSNPVVIVTAAKGTEDTTSNDVFSGMLTAQESYGQITWTSIRPFVARGRTLANVRIVVVDIDNASAHDAVHAAAWVVTG
jgi:hypothetical protein